MSTTFSITYKWLPSDNLEATERWTAAEIDIKVGSACATEVEDVVAKTVRSSARLSALRLAEWFAANWWRLLWEPRVDTYSWRASHKVGNAGHGYVWPDLSFSSDWQWVHVRSRPTTRWDVEPIRYLNHFDHLVPIRDFETGVDDFIDGTIARLSGVQADQSELSALWSEVASERSDPDCAALRKLEACMGYDPDEAPLELLESLRHQMGLFGERATQEMAAAYKQEAISHLKDLLESSKNGALAVRVPKRGDIRSRLTAETDDSDIPWQRAERAAQIAREVWNLSLPISTETFCDLMQIGQADFRHTQPHGSSWFLAGLRETDDSDAFRVQLSSKYDTSRRFGLARMVADHIAADEGDRLLPGTRSLTSRQKFQRAFAQELLCPFDTLKEHVDTEAPNSEDIYDAARYFDVSPVMVHATLVNKGMMGRETLDDWGGWASANPIQV